MGIIQVMKMVSLCTFLFLILLPFVRSSQDQSNETYKDNTKAELSDKLLFEITTHGFLLWASIGFLIPIGILTIRMSNTVRCGTKLRVLFQIHVVSQILGAVVATAGAILSFKNFNNSFNNNHQRIGVTLYGFIWFQVLTGFLRPRRGSKRRSVWFLVHWMIGTLMSLMGVFSIYSGLQAYHEKTSREIRIWASLFTAQICFIGLFYLCQDKWIYILKQSKTVDYNLSPPKQKHKELVTESS